MAQLGGYGAETREEREQRLERERVYGPTPRPKDNSETKPKEKS